MIGLFERDYSTLTNEEKKEQERLDIESIVPGTKIKKNCYHQYPKAVRHYLSLFPNNFMDTVDLKDEQTLLNQCNDFLSVLNQKRSTELDIKHIIQNNRYYHIPASLLGLYYFGHHGAYVFKEFKLGTSYTADYVLVGDSSNGNQFVFVECENPYSQVTIADGNFGETIRKGINQINDWKAFISSDYTIITSEFKKYTNEQLPDEFYSFDVTRFNYIVIAGRRTDFNDKTYRLARQSEKDNNIRILHYDNWYDLARSSIGKVTY